MTGFLMGPMEEMRVPSLLIRTTRIISISARRTDGSTSPTTRAQRGNAWRELGKRDDLVLDSIVVDPLKPGRILVGAWVLGRTDRGPVHQR